MNASPSGLGFTSRRLIAAPAPASTQSCADLLSLAGDAARAGFRPAPTSVAGGPQGRGGSSTSATARAARGFSPSVGVGQATTFPAMASNPTSALAAPAPPLGQPARLDVDLPARSLLASALLALALATLAILAAAILGLLLADALFGYWGLG